MLQSAIEAEVDDFIVGHAQRADDQGRRLVVRNGSLPEREILTGAGKLVVRQPRVRDKSPGAGDRVTFSPNVLPPYLKRTESIEELIPWLYLKGISTGDFSEAVGSKNSAELKVPHFTRFTACQILSTQPVDFIRQPRRLADFRR